VDGRIISEENLGKYGVKVYNGCMSQDRDQWQAVLNMVINLWFHKRKRIS
jgi:hypothetical protein